MASFPGKIIGVILSVILLIIAPMIVVVLVQNIRTERMTWNAVTYYTDLVGDKGVLHQNDYEEFVAMLGATMMDYEIVINVQRKIVIPDDAVSHTIKYMTVGLWKSSNLGVVGSTPLEAGDNVQVVLNPMSQTRGDQILSRVLGLHTVRRPIAYAVNVRNDGG